MYVFTSLGILILAMLIQSFLQLSPSLFMLLTHFNRGKYSTKKSDRLSIFFIIGAELVNVLIFLSIYFILCLFSYTTIIFENPIFYWIISGILIGLSFISFFVYYRKSKGTKLFISSKIAKNLQNRASSTKSTSDAFLLGIASEVPELIFTIPLYIICSFEIMNLGQNPYSRAALILLYIIITIIPLFIIHFRYQFGYNLANLQKNRTKNKLFYRSIISLSYLLIAILFIAFRIF